MELGLGRAVLDMDNHSDQDSVPGFDAHRFIAHMFRWLARRL
jgi:hypothetical protein